MKKVILLLISIFLATSAISAQNANRKGFFMELQGGLSFGDIVKAEINKESKNYGYEKIAEATYLKGGVSGSFDIGYRFRTSNHFALEVKLGLWANFADFRDTWQMRFMPGLRWTSKEFSGNISSFVSGNIGIGTAPSDGYFGDNVFIPAEIAAGLNFSPQFYMAFVWNINVMLTTCNPTDYINKLLVEYETNTYNTVGLRFGVRF